MEELELTQNEITETVHNFMQEYFKKTDEVLTFHTEFLTKYDFIEPEIDYSRLRIFLDTAAHDIKSLDPTIFTGLLVKLHKDFSSLHDYLRKFEKDMKVSKVVYIRDFLENIKLYRDMFASIGILSTQKSSYKAAMNSAEAQLRQMGEAKTPEDVQRQKNAKRRYADSMHKYAEADQELLVVRKKIKQLEYIFLDEFNLQFNQYKVYYINLLKRVVNIKAFYFDKLLWYSAKESDIIRKFFRDSKIEGDYETQTFIKYYVRNLNIDQTREHDWHSYLNECLRMFE